MEDLTHLPMNDALAVRRDQAVMLVPGDGGQGQRIPAFCLLQVRHKIICVPPLHEAMIAP